MKFAALDLGSNTFLCLIGEGSKESGITRVDKDLMQIVRLGQGVGQTGSFHPDALIRARQCLTDFKKEIDKHHVDRILAMATSAARDAKNGEELFKIGNDLGIPIEIIPGEDEARITYQGATSGLRKDQKTSLVVDVGGGSTELIVGRGRQVLFGHSLDIGGVRLTERFISHQPISHQEQADVKNYIQSQISSILPELKRQNIEEVIAVAGTPTSIVAIEVGGFDETKVDGFNLSQERLRHWTHEFATTSVEEKKNKFNLGGRADIIFVGASILLAVLEQLNLSSMTVSTKGVRYGVALEMLQK